MIYSTACYAAALVLLVFGMTACDGRAAVGDEPDTADATRMDCSDFDTSYKGYLPFLITVSKVGDGTVSANLRCRAYQLRNGLPLDGDFRDLRATIDLSMADFAAEEFAEHFSMNCGADRCFAAEVTDSALMIGRVCADKAEGRLRCHRTAIAITSGGPTGLVAAPSSLSGKKALFCLVGLALGLVSGLGLVYLFRLRLTRLLGIGQSTDAKRATVEEERDGGNGATDKSAKLSNGGAPQAAPEEDEDAEEEENHK